MSTSEEERDAPSGRDARAQGQSVSESAHAALTSHLCSFMLKRDMLSTAAD